MNVDKKMAAQEGKLFPGFIRSLGFWYQYFFPLYFSTIKQVKETFYKILELNLGSRRNVKKNSLWKNVKNAAIFESSLKTSILWAVLTDTSLH